MQDYHRLDVWQRAMDYAVAVYEWSANLPGDERFNLAGQLRRAATSVPLNIAEGCGCATRAEFARFLGYAYRSLKEVVTALELCERLYPSLPAPPNMGLRAEGDEIARMVYGLMRRLEEQEPSNQ
jgi:four helix bundle protein